MKVRIVNRRLIFQNNWVGWWIVQAMHNISYMHACTQPNIRCRKYYFQYFQSSIDHKTCLCSFISMLNFQCIWVGEGGGSICIRAVGDWRGPYLHILQFTLAHRTQLDFIQTGVKLSGGEIKPHFWKYLKSIAKRRNIYLVKMGRNPSGPVWIISWFCSQKKMFRFFLTNLEYDRCMLYSVFCIIYFVFHSALCILYSVFCMEAD